MGVTRAQNTLKWTKPTPNNFKRDEKGRRGKFRLKRGCVMRKIITFLGQRADDKHKRKRTNGLLERSCRNGNV